MKNLTKKLISKTKKTAIILTSLALPYFSQAQEEIKIDIKDTINLDKDSFLEEIINAKLSENGHTYVELYAEDKDNDNEYDYIKIKRLAKSFRVMEVEEFYINKKDIVYMDNLEMYSLKEKRISDEDDVYPILNQNYDKKAEMPDKLKRIISEGKIIKFTSENLKSFLKEEYERCKQFEY